MPWYGSHSFLIDFIRRKKCKRIMEIGVLDGENARTMVEIAARDSAPEDIEYYGFDFLSEYESLEVEAKLEKTRCKFRLFKGDTVETLPIATRILPMMDLIFIDGDKSYTTARSDWENSRTLMHDETAVFVHNYEFLGVKEMVDSIPRDKYQVTVIHPRSDSSTALIKKNQS